MSTHYSRYFAEAERVLPLAADASLFNTYAPKAHAHTTWTRLCNMSADGDALRQEPRLAAGRILLKHEA
jgi:hypothetical protein